MKCCINTSVYILYLRPCEKYVAMDGNLRYFIPIIINVMFQATYVEIEWSMRVDTMYFEVFSPVLMDTMFQATYEGIECF